MYWLIMDFALLIESAGLLVSCQAWNAYSLLSVLVESPAGRAIHKKITRAFRKESPGSMVAAKTNYLTNNFVAAKEPPWVALMK